MNYQYQINGHKVERVPINPVYDILKIDDGGGEIQQIDMGNGVIKMTATAWDATQRDLISEVFPQLICKESYSVGLPIWKFRSD